MDQSGWDRGLIVRFTLQVLQHIDHSLCSTEMVAWARIQVMAGFCRRSLRLGSLLARHSQVPESSSVRRVMPSTLTPLVPQAVLMDTRRLRAPSHSCLKESARLISAYHHWISGVGLPTTSQYSSKASPVSLVSDIGDFTNPAGEEKCIGMAGKERAEEGQSSKKVWKGQGMEKEIKQYQSIYKQKRGWLKANEKEASPSLIGGKRKLMSV